MSIYEPAPNAADIFSYYFHFCITAYNPDIFIHSLCLVYVYLAKMDGDYAESIILSLNPPHEHMKRDVSLAIHKKCHTCLGDK